MKKIFFISSGVGRIKRGFEAHVEDLYANFKSTNGREVFLFKGAGVSLNREIKISNLSRSSPLAKVIAFLTGKNAYYIQNVTFFLGLIPYLIKNEIDIIYLGEPILCSFLTKWRKLTGKKFKIIFFTGGQTIPAFIGINDIIHHVSPLCIPKATERGVLEKNQFLIPHFLNLSNQYQVMEANEKNRIKNELNIPEGATVILSVGAIDCSVKRMDYLIKETSKLKENIFLIILGEEGSETKKVKELAKEYFPEGNYRIKTLPRKELHNYYSIADLFVLASLAEGFGIVYIEALSYGLPVIADDNLVTRYVLENHGYYTDMSKEENLKKIITELLKSKFTVDEKNDRYQFVYQKYSWIKVASEYNRMFSERL